MSPSVALPLYSADRLNDAEFVNMFVARTEMFKDIVASLASAAQEKNWQHRLLIGARGMGKSSILRRTALGIVLDPALEAVFVPLRFREEQYNILSLKLFWQNCLDSLAEWSEAHGRIEEAAAIDRDLAALKSSDADEMERAFFEACARVGRRPVLLLDNVDLILDGLTQAEQWKFRRALQADNGPLVIAGATQHLEQAADREAPFYEFFFPVMLEPLSQEEVRSCVQSLAARRKPAGDAVLAALSISPARLPALYALTGGNPRILTLIYQLLERVGERTIFEDLEELLDQVTPFYKARIEEFHSPQQRAVIDAIALNWDPAPSRLICEATGIEATTVSPLLNRLRKSGFIEEVPTSGARSAYQIAERFLNIWYLMRHGSRRTRQKLRWLTLFLTRFYGRDEILTMAERVRLDAVSAWHPNFRDAVFDAERLSTQNFDQYNSSNEAAHHTSSRDPTDRLAAAELELQRMEGERAVDRDQRIGAVLLDKVRALLDLSMFEEGYRVADDVVARYGDRQEADLAQHVARALVAKGRALRQQSQPDAALAAFDDVVARYGDRDEADLAQHVARALMAKGWALEQKSQPDAALAAFDDVVARYGDRQEADLAQHVARALVAKGRALRQQSQPDAALAAYDDVVARYGDRDEADLAQHVARALMAKGWALEQKSQPDAALAAFNDVVARYGDRQEADLAQHVAWALGAKGWALEQKSQPDAALAAYDDVVARYGDRDEADLAQHVAWALVAKGWALRQQSQPDAALAAFDDVVARYGDRQEAELAQHVAQALGAKGWALEQKSQPDAALAAYDDVVARYGDRQEAELAQHVARALGAKGWALEQKSQPDAALAAYDDVVARYGDRQEADLAQHVARALVAKGWALEQKSQPDAALAAFDDVVARYGDRQEAELAQHVARALMAKGWALEQKSQPDAALAAYDDVVARYGDRQEADLAQHVAQALGAKGWALEQKSQPDAALAAYDDVVARYGDRQEAELAQHVARALGAKGWALEQKSQPDAALAAYDDVVARYGDRDEADLAQHVASALRTKGRLLRSAGKSAPALQTFSFAIDWVNCKSDKTLNVVLSNILRDRARLLTDDLLQLALAEADLRQAHALAADDILTAANLVWTLLLQADLSAANELRPQLSGLPNVGLNLIDSAIALLQRNMGEARVHLQRALEWDLDAGETLFAEDLHRLLRLAFSLGLGADVIAMFDETDMHETHAPVRAAFDAIVNGPSTLNDVNPEVRATALLVREKINPGGRLETQRPAPAPSGRQRRPR